MAKGGVKSGYRRTRSNVSTDTVRWRVIGVWIIGSTCDWRRECGEPTHWRQHHTPLRNLRLREAIDKPRRIYQDYKYTCGNVTTHCVRQRVSNMWTAGSTCGMLRDCGVPTHLAAASQHTPNNSKWQWRQHSKQPHSLPFPTSQSPQHAPRSLAC